MKMTLGTAFSATAEFFRKSWLVTLAMMLSIGVVMILLSALMVGSAFTYGAIQENSPQAFAVIGQMMLLMLFAFILYNTACFLSWRHGLTDGRESVLANIGWALGAALLYFGMLIGLYIVGVIVFYIFLFILIIIGVSIFGIAGLSMDTLPTTAAGLGIGMILFVIILYIALLVGSLWLNGRLSIIGPAMAAQRTVNPFTGLAASWRITRASQWTIVGFFVIVTIAAFLVAMVIAMIAGGVIGAATSGGSSANASFLAAIVPSLVLLLAFVPLLLVWVAIPGGLYRAMAPVEHGDVFA